MKTKANKMYERLKLMFPNKTEKELLTQLMFFVMPQEEKRLYKKSHSDFKPIKFAKMQRKILRRK